MSFRIRRSGSQSPDTSGNTTGTEFTYKLPWPKPEMDRVDPEDPLSKIWLYELTPMLLKLGEWSFFFFLAYFGFGYSWVILLATLHYIQFNKNRSDSRETVSASHLYSSEQQMLCQTLSTFPSWVTFPDFARVEWINDILAMLWPSIEQSGFVYQFVMDFIEPEIRRILDRMQLEHLSGFAIKKISIGTIPARIGGIKVYTDRSISRKEILLDAEVTYCGDARVLFSLQGVQAEIKQIQLKGMARIILKPILNAFPFIGGFEFYFLNTPTLEYSLGGLGTLAEIPGANSLVKIVVVDQIKSRFVWPNRFRLYFPIDPVKNVPDLCYMLSKPSGVLKLDIVEARNLLKMDKSFTGPGKSDPYVIVTLGERKVSFRNKYIAKTVDPKWNYTLDFVMEDPSGQDVKIDVYDYDNSSSDDFLGRKSLSLSSLVEKVNSSQWLNLDEVKHGDIYVQSQWKPAYPLDDEEDSIPMLGVSHFVVSLFVHRCENLNGGNKTPYPKCVIKHKTETFTTAVKNKSRNPVFDEGFLLSFPGGLDNEYFDVEVVDSKGGELGRTRISMEFIQKLSRREFFNMQWQLDGEGCIYLSAKLYGIKSETT